LALKSFKRPFKGLGLEKALKGPLKGPEGLQKASKAGSSFHVSYMDIV
jgi:hypothetical protein